MKGASPTIRGVPDKLARGSMAGAALLFLLTGCMTGRAALPDGVRSEEQVQKAFAVIDARNRTVKRSKPWLSKAYRAITVDELGRVPQDRYADYGTYAPDGKAYIIVHPGYFPFFDAWSVTPITTDYSGGLPRKNVVERIADRLRPIDVAYQVTLQQERIIRDFIEFLSVEKRLLILILPRDYRRHLTYGLVPGYDEYARYLNELTNGAENILTLESDAPDNGFLRDADLDRLAALFDAAGVDSLLLGGGYLGTCLDNLTASLRKRYDHEQISFVTDLTMVSPAAVVSNRAQFLSFWGTLRPGPLREYLASVPANRTTSEPLRWADLSLYSVSRIR